MSGRTGRRPIQRLLPTTVDRIAAGEVVERPASVVKELVENAVDAGSRSVVVRITGGGLDRIEVADDGAGIPPEELPLAVERHATSKLLPDGPLDAIATLGFRGEALAAIGAVARLRITSRPPDREAAEGISVVGGTVGPAFPAARAPGTTVAVDDLFFNTPARRKFLHSPPAEQVELVRTVERLYLARPSVALTVFADGREIADLPATERLADAAARVLGPEFLDASFEVDGPVPGGRAVGAIGLPSVASATSTGLYLAVNGRAIVARGLTQAVRAAFGDALPRSRFPVGVLHLELDARVVDANVHPAKREVRFARSRELDDAVRRAVRESLLGAPALDDPGPARAAAPGGRAETAKALVGGEGRAVARSEQRTLLPPAAPVAVTGQGPARVARRFELLGVVDALYWVAATDDGFALVDQHAASERLLFETLRRDGSLARQQLVEPVTVRLSAAERASLATYADAVERAGFAVDRFGPESVRVRSVPSYRGRSASATALPELLRELAEGRRPTVPDGLEERRAASIACHAAIRAGDPVAPEELARLIEALPDTVRSCPHGRPIYVRLSRSRLDGWFLRRGG